MNHTDVYGTPLVIGDVYYYTYPSGGSLGGYFVVYDSPTPKRARVRRMFPIKISDYTTTVLTCSLTPVPEEVVRRKFPDYLEKETA